MRLLALIVIALVVGPLLGIVVDRAAGRLRVLPEHRCVSCHEGQGRRSLVPVVNWFQRCQHCERHKGMRYAAVDVLLAGSFGLLGWRFDDLRILVPYLMLSAVLVALSVIDFETHLLPNNVVWPSILTGLFLVLVVSGELGYEQGIYSALFGAGLLGGTLGLLHVVYEPGMGRGDVKLALLLGLFVGWIEPGLIGTVQRILYVMLVAFGSAGLVGLAYNAIRRRRGEIPFGPALAGATMLVVLVSPGLT